MADIEQDRPDPDALLSALKKEEEKEIKGKLKIFFGMCAGVGKTYEMLKAAHEVKSKGIDVLIGYVETHKRAETEALLEGLYVLPRKNTEYRGTSLEEMDIDAILARKPQLVLVDELAHTNAPGSRHAKRFQDVQELLDAGIDIYTTLNVQHLESRADTVAQITGAIIRETVPDSVFESANEIEIIDIPPDELLKRLSEGKVYTTERSQQAIQNFFRKGNLTALREMSLRMTAERVDHQLREFMKAQQIPGVWKSIQRLLVGISSSPDSITLIRWARRMSYMMDASWIVVYVETSRALRDTAKEQLAKNLALARELGAEVVTTADEDIVQGLLRVARQQNATQVLVGKSKSMFNFGNSLLDRLIERSGDLDIYVAGGMDENGRKRFWHLPEIHSGLPQYTTALLIVAILVAICYPLRPIIGYQTISLILLFVVAVFPLKLGMGPVITAATLSAVAWDYFFIPPQFTFTIKEPQDILMFGAYFVIAAVTGVLTTRIRAREKAVLVREERAVALYSLTKDLSAATSLDGVLKAAVENFKRFFDADVVACLSESDGDLLSQPHPASSMVLDEKELSVAAWTYWNERRAGKFTDTLPSAQATYYPLTGPRYPLGVLGIRLLNKEPLTLEHETLLENFIRQISSSIEREQLNELTRKTLVVAESERLYRNLFDSISHEFKTPIATILGSVEHLQSGASFNDPDDEAVIEDVHHAAIRLNRLVANMLDMTRLESGLLKPNFKWCDISELFSSAIHKLDEELVNHKVEINIADALPLIKLDWGLIEQALMNLIHNATVHTPKGTQIYLGARLLGEDCMITVSDNGPGILPENSDKVFQKFYRAPGSTTGGTGLGLSIARGFVEVHGGTLSFENRKEGGAQFTIRIPIDKTADGKQR